MKITNSGLNERNPFLFSKYRLNGGTVELSVSLRPRPMHRRTPRLVQHAKLNAGTVYRLSHQPVKRINFTDEVTLAKPSDRGIAGHFTNF